MAKVNFTSAVERELLKRAKTGRRPVMETFEAAEAVGNYRTLLDFSLGRINDRAAMTALGIDNEEDLFLLMAQAHLPMPRLPPAITQHMIDDLKGLSG